jgi:hypothetical protein
MSSLAPYSDSAATTTSTLITPDPHPRCRKCGNNLTKADKQKRRDQYWKRCKQCRDRETAANRRRKAVAATRRASDISTRTSLAQIFQSFPPGRISRERNLSPFNSSESSLDTWDNVFPGSYSSSVNHENNIHPIDQPLEQTTSEPNTIYQNNENIVINPEDQLLTVRDCTVCSSSLPLSSFPQLTSCKHTSDVCHTCLLQWLNQNLATQDTQSILCPSDSCTSLIQHQDVHKYAPADVFARYVNLCTRSLLSADKDFLYCLAAGCTSGQIHFDRTQSPIFRCAACGYRMCTAHVPLVAFHEGETCKEFERRLEAEKNAQEEQARKRREQEEASVQAVKQRARECPGCGAQIEKVSGCDHMTCKFLIHCFF